MRTEGLTPSLVSLAVLAGLFGGILAVAWVVAVYLRRRIGERRR